MSFLSALSHTNTVLRKVVNPLSRTDNIIGTAFLLGMMLLTTGDVISRYFINYPIPGTFELVEFMLSIVIFFGLAYTAVQKGHIIVDLLFLLLPGRVRLVVAVITVLLSIALFIVALIGVIQLIIMHIQTHAVSSVLEIPVYPFTIAIAFGIALLCLVLFTEMLTCINEGPEK